MLGEYVGVLIAISFAVFLAALMAVVHRRSGRSPLIEPQEATVEDPRRTPAGLAKKLQFVAVLSLVGSAAAVFLYPWAATFRELGSSTLVAIGLFAVPILVGFGYQWARRAADGWEW